MTAEEERFIKQLREMPETVRNTVLDIIKDIPTADKTELLLVLVALGAIAESGGRTLPSGTIKELKSKFAPEDFAAALDKNRLVITTAQNNGNTVLLNMCRKAEAFIRRYLIERR